VYKLEAGNYQLQQGEPYWMPEVGIGIGRCEIQFGNFPREVLTWYDEMGIRHFSEAEQKELRAERAEVLLQEERLLREQAEAEAQQDRLRVERLEALLRAQGIDPDNLPE
jgi:regulator of protease activity HflC (stomatin/prohibitin superfamily)